MSLRSHLHGTAIPVVRRDGRCAMAGDGQVTLGRTVVKHGARTVRRLHGGDVKLRLAPLVQDHDQARFVL